MEEKMMNACIVLDSDGDIRIRWENDTGTVFFILRRQIGMGVTQREASVDKMMDAANATDLEGTIWRALKQPYAGSDVGWVKIGPARG